MIIVLQIFFWSAAFVVLHSYVFYPFLLRMLVAFRKPVIEKSQPQNTGVSILMSVYNEEKVISHKLDSIINSDFDIEKIEVIIGSDCSSDDTEQIIEKYSREHPQIKLIKFSERQGKPPILNRLIQHASYEYVIFTDANVFFDRSNISNLLKSFSDRTGLVGATIVNRGLKKTGISLLEGSYIQGENRQKYHEGVLWGTMMGPFGGCFMMRKHLFEPIPPNFIVDDFYLSMIVLEKGFQSKCADDALCFEDVPDEMNKEFNRKKRISAGNYQNLKRFSKFIAQPFTAIGFCFLSHKVFRWWGPFAIIIAALTSLVLSFYSLLYMILFLLIFLLLSMPLIDLIQKKLKVNNFLVRMSAYFIFMNWALLAGYVQYRKGITTNVWNRTDRTI